ncbi:MAG: zinc-ribbon domain-containing protein [Chloroflexota bacterium]
MTRQPAEQSAIARCSRCGQAVGPDDRFCPACGAPRRVTCPSCGALATGEARACPECGGPLPIPAPLLGGARPPVQTTVWSRRGFQLLVGASACLLAIFAAVAWVYFSSPDRRKDVPASQVAIQVPTTFAMRSGTSPLALIGTSSGVLISQDQGSVWNRLLIEGGVTAVGAGTSDSSPIYLAGGHFWRGDQRGFQQVATDLPGGPVQALAVDPSDPERVYAVVAARGLFQSDDAGQHWAQLGSAVPDGVTGLVLVGGARRLFFIATSGHGVFASADGRSWTNANGFVNGALPTQTVFSLAYDPHSGDRYVSPTGDTMSGALYAGTDVGLFKSIDGGESWGPLPFRQAVAAIAVSTTGDRLMLAIDPNGNVYRSRDGGVSW